MVLITRSTRDHWRVGALTGSRGEVRRVSSTTAAAPSRLLGEEGGVRGELGGSCPCEAWFTLGQRGLRLCGDPGPAAGRLLGLHMLASWKFLPLP